MCNFLNKTYSRVRAIFLDNIIEDYVKRNANFNEIISKDISYSKFKTISKDDLNEGKKILRRMFLLFQPLLRINCNNLQESEMNDEILRSLFSTSSNFFYIIFEYKYEYNQTWTTINVPP